MDQKSSRSETARGSTPQPTHDSLAEFEQHFQPNPAASPPPLSYPSSSSGSTVPWAELLKQQSPPSSEDELMIGSMPEVRVESLADDDVMRQLRHDAAASGILEKLSGESSKKIRGIKASQPEHPRSATSPRAEELPSATKILPSHGADPRPGAGATPSTASSVPLGVFPRTSSGHSNAHPFELSKTEATAPCSSAYTTFGTSTVNLGNMPGMPLTAVGLGGSTRSYHGRSIMTQRSRSIRHSAWLGGAALGASAVAVLMGILTLFVRPKSSPPQTTSITMSEDSAQPEVGQRYLEGGEPELALQVFSRCPDTPHVLAGRGQARWLSYLRKQRHSRMPLSEDDQEVTEARRELIAAKTAESALWLGLINEVFGQWRAAREVYETALGSYPSHTRLFKAACARLDALLAAKDRAAAIPADPRLGLALMMTFVEMPVESGGAVEEAGFAFWEAVAAAQRGDFEAGKAAMLRAKAAHIQRRDQVLRGQNPLSDPREDIFLHSSDQLIAYWEVRSQLRAAGFNEHSPQQALHELIEVHRRYEEARRSAAQALGTQPTEDLAVTVNRLARQRMEAQEEWKRAAAALHKAREEWNRQAEAWEDRERVALNRLKAATDREHAARKAWEETMQAKKNAEAAFQGIRERLARANLIGPGDELDEVLRALDQLLLTSVSDKDREIARLRRLLQQAQQRAHPVPADPVRPDPDLAERFFAEGVQLYLRNRFIEAEEYFVAAIRNHERDARYHYLLGLARWASGYHEVAEADFRRGAELEKRGMIDRAGFTALLERLQGPARRALSRYRP